MSALLSRQLRPVSMSVLMSGVLPRLPESAGVACAVLLSWVPVAVVVVVVVVVVACACKFVKVTIKGRAYVATGVFIPFLSPIVVVADDSSPFSGLDILSLCGCVRACGRLRLFPFP